MIERRHQWKFGSGLSNGRRNKLAGWLALDIDPDRTTPCWSLDSGKEARIRHQAEMLIGKLRGIAGDSNQPGSYLAAMRDFNIAPIWLKGLPITREGETTANAGDDDQPGQDREITDRSKAGYLEVIGALARALADCLPETLKGSDREPLTGTSIATGDTGIVGHLRKHGYTTRSDSDLRKKISAALKKTPAKW
ncbi:hypothetical protein Thivi_4618 [Thiocystis violascens DSM 198]|uniref:Uncharacterized protein n=1 Tax=Thiocystis violascens (strain ATCC 17096 / DSM 198 / 6111) TaxID=765911 RepID=I3YHE1_THIV6|nr:hypothetical protein Thivi_4618 [Thiocystis violascens DSM 198]